MVKPHTEKPRAANEPSTDIRGSLPASELTTSFRRVKLSEVGPKQAVAKILDEHAELANSFKAGAIEAARAEPEERLRPVRAFESLVNAAFRVASQGPEFLLPAAVSFVKAATETKKLHGVDCPSVKDAFANPEILERRSEVVPAPILLTSKLKDLSRGSSLESSMRVKEGQHVSIFFGFPLIELSGTYRRLPAPGTPIENALLTSAFLTLIEESLHAVQHLKYDALDQLGVREKTFDAKAALLSDLTLQYLKSEGRDPDKAAFGSNHDRVLEIDVLARMLELAKEHDFPVKCMFQELFVFHPEWRRGFVNWLKQRDTRLDFNSEEEYYLEQRGTAATLADPDRSSNALPERGADLLELLEEAGSRVLVLKRLRVSLSEPGALDQLEARSAILSAPQLSHVLHNIERAVKDGEVLPKRWFAFAKEEVELHQDGLAAVVLEDYLRQIGYLRPE